MSNNGRVHHNPAGYPIEALLSVRNRFLSLLKKVFKEANPYYALQYLGSKISKLNCPSLTYALLTCLQTVPKVRLSATDRVYVFRWAANATNSDAGGQGSVRCVLAANDRQGSDVQVRGRKRKADECLSQAFGCAAWSDNMSGLRLDTANEVIFLRYKGCSLRGGRIGVLANKGGGLTVEASISPSPFNVCAIIEWQRWDHAW